jgi:hypothetical protein
MQNMWSPCGEFTARALRATALVIIDLPHLQAFGHRASLGDQYRAAKAPRHSLPRQGKRDLLRH